MNERPRGSEAQWTRRGIHFQVAGRSLGWLVAGKCLTQWETGGRMIGGGCIYQVTGDGRGLQEFRRQPFGSRPQGPDCRWPKRRFLRV